jgi:hypothetical protein
MSDKAGVEEEVSLLEGASLEPLTEVSMLIQYNVSRSPT